MTASRELTALLTQSMPAVLGYFQRRVPFDDAPDLLAETLTVAWRRIGDLPEDPERARMWLFGIARGTLLNHARGERRRRALVDRLRHRVTASSPPADAGSDVRDAIERPGGDLAELIRLVHWDGFTVAEADEILGIPETTARSRYRRAKEQLRAALAARVP